jgi:hypothetical protein
MAHRKGISRFREIKKRVIMCVEQRGPDQNGPGETKGRFVMRTWIQECAVGLRRGCVRERRWRAAPLRVSVDLRLPRGNDERDDGTCESRRIG